MIRTRRGYTALLGAMLPGALLRLLMRSRREPEYRRHLRERFGYYRFAKDRPIVWIHAVSVGETRAAQPLIERLAARYPDHRILLTHMTPTGRAAGEQLYGDRVAQAYLPYDFPGAGTRFLDHFQPVVGLLMETEIWFNLIHICHERGVPLYLVNARLSERSRVRYQRLPELVQTGLNELRAIGAQTQSDERELHALGARNVTVTGNVKFDITVPASMQVLGEHWRGEWGRERPVFLAASTRDGEETLLLEALARSTDTGMLTVIVPRHPQRFDEVAALIERKGLNYARRSAGTQLTHSTRVLLGDSMGELFAYYAACDVAFIGGSLLPFGSHNLLEACAVGRPVICGPSDYNFAEATDDAVAAGAAVRAADAHEVLRLAVELLHDPARRHAMAAAGEAFVREHRGAADRTLALVRPKSGDAVPPEPTTRGRPKQIRSV